MVIANPHPKFSIKASSWESSTPESKKEFAQLVKSDTDGAHDFCKLYCERFLLVHEIGHIIQELFENKDTKKSEAKKEYDANLFAIKYFHYKKETEYLKELFKWTNYLLENYKVKIQYNLKDIDLLFEKYKQDRRTYGSLQFVLMNEAIKEKKEFENVLVDLSTGHLSEINKSIILRKDIEGSDLVSECIEFIFSMYELHPIVEIEYGPRLGFQTLEEEF